MYQLRDYQEELIQKVRTSMSKGNKSIIVQSPPRTGKTVTMAEIARLTTRKGNRCLFLVHRKEIINQAMNTFEIQKCDMNLVDFMMIQTAYRRVERLPHYDVIFVDEAHHALAKTYQTVLTAYPNAIQLLFTATPIRTGKKQLDMIADDIVLGKSIQQLTDEGNLAPFKYYSIDYVDKLKLKKSSTGDYTADSMEESMSRKIYGDVVKHYRKYANGMQAVLYCYSIESAKEFADIFNNEGISAVEVDGTTPDNERDEYVEQFRNGEIKIMTNVNLFTEGIDLPNVDCVIMVRPTASLSLYLQFAMRCLNPREGKEAVIIDHVGNWQRFGLPNEDRNWRDSIISGEEGTKKKRNKEDDEIKARQCPTCTQVIPVSDIIDNRCPYCGSSLSEEKETEFEEVDLIEIESQKRMNLFKELQQDELKLSVASKSPKELRTYEELKAYAEVNNYKPGWVYYQAKMKGLM